MRLELLKKLKESQFEKGAEDNLQGDFDYLRNSSVFSSFSFDEFLPVFISYLKIIGELDLADFHSQKIVGKEDKWEGDSKHFFEGLHDFIEKNYSRLKKESVHFFDFEFCYIKWEKIAKDID